MRLDRRQVMVGGAALAAGLGVRVALGTGREAAAVVAGPEALPPAGPPMDYLSRRFPPEMLRRALLSVTDWHPAPKAVERGAWEALPADLRQSVLNRAAKVPHGVLPTLPASMFLHYHLSGSRQPYDNALAERRKRLTPLVLAECVEGKGRYLGQIGDIVWATCEESFWGIPAHVGSQKAGETLPDVTEPLIELFGAEMAMDLAWTAYLVGDGLNGISPLIHQRIKLEVSRRILEPGRTRDDFWWMGLGKNVSRVNNWNPWICSNWLSALLLLEDDRTRRLDGVTKILRVVDVYVNQYPADGGEDEGPGYWSRSPASYFDCVSLLVSATGGNVETSDVLQHPFFRSMGEYIVKAHMAGEDFTNYGDAHLDARPSGALMYSFGRATGSEVLASYGAFRSRQGLHNVASAEEESKELFATDEDLGRCLRRLLAAPELRQAGGRDGLLRDAWYPVLGFMAARQQEGTDAGFYLAAQAAANGRSHGHCDSGSFLVSHDGSPVCIDLGATTYTKATFGADRYKLWALRSSFHNLPTIGGVEQDHGRTDKATVLEYSSSNAVARLTCNLATAYPTAAGVTYWKRTMELRRGAGEVVVAEDFALAKPAAMMLTFMTPRVPSAAPGVVRLAPADTAKKAVELVFDASQLEAKLEPVDLTDEGLKAQWGARVWRVLLVSRADVAAGKWMVRLRSA